MPTNGVAPVAPKVPVGPTSIAGFGTTLVAAVMAVLAYKSGDHSEQTVGVIVAGAVAAVSLVTTLVGRFAQAHASIDAQATVAASRRHLPTSELPPLTETDRV